MLSDERALLDGRMVPGTGRWTCYHEYREVAGYLDPVVFVDFTLRQILTEDITRAEREICEQVIDWLGYTEGPNLSELPARLITIHGGFSDHGFRVARALSIMMRQATHNQTSQLHWNATVDVVRRWCLS